MADATESMPDVTRFFHPLMRATRLRKRPRRVEIAGRAYVVFRDADGKPAVLDDACPHRNAPLSLGRIRSDGRLACPFHGWHFDGNGNGRSPSQPSLKCGTRSYQVVERYGYLWMADRATPLSEFPEIDTEGYELAGTFSVRFRAPLHVVYQIFAEDEHFAWVHTRLGWNEEQLEQRGIEYEAENFPDRTEVHYRGPQRPSPLLPFMLIRSNDTFDNRWVARFDPIRTVFTLSWCEGHDGPPRPLVYRVVVFKVPETATTTRVHAFAFVKIAPTHRLLAPIVKPATMALTWREVMDDASFCAKVANTPIEMKGMRLGKYDKPVIHGMSLIKKIYYGNTTADSLVRRRIATPAEAKKA